jgi:ribosomal protein S18 acetylase RimI-like enzyme
MAADSEILITPVRTSSDLKDTVAIFDEYAEFLGFDLAFQDFEEERTSMPGKYGPPKGELLLARDHQGRVAGCAALRPLSQDGVCEMKRLYVPEARRGSGVGKALALRIIDIAEKLGYSEMKLDTLTEMKTAVGMYQRLGFVQIEAYYDSPMENALYLGLKLPRNS